jgi:hypothetical protein
MQLSSRFTIFTATALKLTVISFYILFFFSCSLDIRSETWDDPTPRESEFTVHDLHDACVEATRHDYSYFPFSSSKLSEEQRAEHDRKSAMVALQVYTKQNNMQVTPISNQ